MKEYFNENTSLYDVIHDPSFQDYGRLLLPVNKGYYSGHTIKDLSLVWYEKPDVKITTEIFNTLKQYAEEGKTIFFDIYTDKEKAEDPRKKDTGLFFFEGKKNAPVAICNAGGGFAYVGAVQDSFPHALTLSKMGFNAFALIYRPGWDTAMEDLARAISFLYDHASELSIDMNHYSLWGGSAGARMAATLGNKKYLDYLTGRKDIPQASSVIMQYTGHDEVSLDDAPTYACVGDNDFIADWRVMQRRLMLLKRYGIPVEFHVYHGLHHGFGLGIGTVAEGWIKDAVSFWKENMHE